LPHPHPKDEVLIMLKELVKDDVPTGTEVWSSVIAHRRRRRIGQPFYRMREAAEAANLVTGNLRHFPKKRRTNNLVTPNALIELVRSSLAGEIDTHAALKRSRPHGGR
jgi:hypothetical protein